jgi:hypothetical protein
MVEKVRVESLMWGAGTALGELPPYFMARAARLSGEVPEDEDIQEFLALQKAAAADEDQDEPDGKLVFENLFYCTYNL